MRKAILTILMAATAASPALAQDNDGGWRGRGHRDGESSEQRSEARTERMQQREQAQQQREQVQQQRVERQSEPRQQTEARSWQGRSGGTWQRGGESQQAVQVQQQQQQQQVRTEAYRGSRGGNWSGGGDRNAQRFQAEREASQRSAEQTIGGNYARRAYENERNYERDTLRREGRRDNDRRWDGNRNNYRNDNYRRSYNWNRDWRNDRRYDWQRYRYSNRSIFNLGRYYSPYRDYSYNRLSIGFVLDELFFGRNYWIDPLYYHLPPAPPGTQWVRYYDDVLLVDVYSGEVVDVIYDFFY